VKRRDWVGRQVSQEFSNPRERVEFELAAYKHVTAMPPPDGSVPPLVHQLNHAWAWENMTPSGRLYLLESFIDWEGVTAKDKRAVIEREVLPGSVSKEQRAFVKESLKFDREDPDAQRNGAAYKQKVLADYEKQLGTFSPDLRRAEREVRALKSRDIEPPINPDREPPRPWHEHTEPVKLYLLETRVNWWGVDKAEMNGILAREVDFTKAPNMSFMLMRGLAQMDRMEGLTATRSPEKEIEGPEL
jgi:hypothetical protein